MIIPMIFPFCFSEESPAESSATLLSNNETYAKNVQILIPNSWIEKLCDIHNSDNKTELVKEFAEIIYPIHLNELNHDPENDDWSINPILADIDSDLEYEILATIKKHNNYPVLLVFKKIDNNWYLLYLEPFYVHYNEPELYIANNYSPNKTFYIRWLHRRGSGIYKDAYHFYKLIDNKVYPCLVLINEARIYGWGLLLNQDVKSDFKFSSTRSDELRVVYNYNFFPGPIFEDNAPWQGNPDIPFVKGTDDLFYEWDDDTKTYLPRYYSNSSKNITEEKLMCFDDFGNDQSFIKAFEYEINETLRNGTDMQKDVLKWYLEIVNE